MRILFVGINPSLYSGAVGHHFARPGNRFWKTLHAAGLTQRLVSPFEESELLGAGIGVTNLVNRATAAASELSDDELRRGARRLERKVLRYGPSFVAILGISAYRTAFARRDASFGPRPESIGDSRIWVLPNPSGLNAHFQLDDLARVFADLRAAAFPRSAATAPAKHS